MADKPVNLDRAFIEYLQVGDGYANAKGVGVTSTFGGTQNWVVGASFRDAENKAESFATSSYQMGLGYAFYGENLATTIAAGAGEVGLIRSRDGRVLTQSKPFVFTSLNLIYRSSETVELTAGMSMQQFSSREVGTAAGMTVGINLYLTEKIAFALNIGTDDKQTTVGGISLIHQF